MHTHSPQGENIPKNSHPCVAATRGGRKIFFGHTQCVHTPLVQKPVPTYDCPFTPQTKANKTKSGHIHELSIKSSMNLPKNKTSKFSLEIKLSNSVCSRRMTDCMLLFSESQSITPSFEIGHCHQSQ